MWQFDAAPDGLSGPRLAPSVQKAFAADFAASVAVGLVAAGFTDFPYFVKSQLHRCRDAILDLGFDETTRDDANEILHDAEGAKLIIVTGCQDERMLQRRVDKLTEFASDMYKHGTSFSIVFSGRCPKHDNVRIPNEAMRMHNLFTIRLRDENPDLLASLPILSLEGEEESSDTKENVTKFFNHAAFLGHRAVNLVALSSTFHLIRLSKEIMLHVSKNAENGAWPRFGELLLVGAEDDFTIKSALVADTEFMKLMMFDLYNIYLE